MLFATIRHGWKRYGLWLSRTTPTCVLELSSAPSDHAIWMWNYLDIDGVNKLILVYVRLGTSLPSGVRLVPLKREPRPILKGQNQSSTEEINLGNSMPLLRSRFSPKTDGPRGLM